VFLDQNLDLRDGKVPKPVELQAVPHVLVEAQFVTSQGKPRGEGRIAVGGALGGNGKVPILASPKQLPVPNQSEAGRWSASTVADANGRVLLRAPRGLRQAVLSAYQDEGMVPCVRRAKDQPLSPDGNLALGTLQEDFRGIQILAYPAPILFVKPVSPGTGELKDLRVTAFYQRDRYGYAVHFEALSDGRFRAARLHPDIAVTVTVSASGYETAKKEVNLPGAEMKEVVVELKKTPTPSPKR